MCRKREHQGKSSRGSQDRRRGAVNPSPWRLAAPCPSAPLLLFLNGCHRDATFHASRSRGGSNGRRPVLGCRIGGPAGALGVIQRHGRGCGDDRLLGNCCLRDTRVDGSRLRSSTRATNSPTTRAAHTRDSSAYKFPDVTTNRYNQTTSPVQFLLNGEALP